MADWTRQHGTPGNAGADPVDRVIEETRAFVEARPLPDLEAAVMLAIEQTGQRPAGGWRRLAGSLWTPRVVSFRVRPAYGVLAAAAVLALAVLAPAGWRTSGEGAPPAPAAAQDTLLVQFRLEAPGVSDVRLAGSFTEWQQRYELYQTAPGLWTITIALPPGVHDYAFVVDGERWVADPYALSVHDGFGGTNSRIALVPPGSRL
jgi:hypothetical protein